MRVSPGRAQAAMSDAFASGGPSTTALRDIVGRADDYYRDALTRAMREGKNESGSSPIDVPRLADRIAQPPAWLPDYVDLSTQISEQPGLATDALRFADLLLLQALVADGPIPR